MIKSGFISILVFFLFTTSAVAKEVQGKIISVIDGDTVILQANNNRKIIVRLDYVDAPESGQPYGDQAKAFLLDLVLNRDVIVQDNGRDKYHRMLGIIQLPNADMPVNRQLLLAGTAWIYPAAMDRVLILYQEEAQKDRKGLWALPDGQRIPPWTWRKQQKSANSAN